MQFFTQKMCGHVCARTHTNTSTKSCATATTLESGSLGLSRARFQHTVRLASYIINSS